LVMPSWIRNSRMVVFKTGRSPVKLSDRSRAYGLWSDRGS